MKVLIVGDLIKDHYRICKVKGNLCAEMPLPQLTVTQEYTTDGGAGLVAANLRSLTTSAIETDLLHRTVSRKERIGIIPFNQWVCRLDYDSLDPTPDPQFQMRVYDAVHSTEYGLVIISDYGKHTLNYQLARLIVEECRFGRYQKPLFVDARHHWDWYMGAYAAFPNDAEYRLSMKDYYEHVIHKAGAEGCYVDGFHIPITRSSAIPIDVCGAGDVFLAGFAAAFAEHWADITGRKLGEQSWLHTCAAFGNRAAGISVQRFGTYVVKPSDFRGWNDKTPRSENG